MSLRQGSPKATRITVHMQSARQTQPGTHKVVAVSVNESLGAWGGVDFPKLYSKCMRLAMFEKY